MYADDLKIYYRVNNVDDAYHLQNDLNPLFLWCHDKLLNLNIQKCKTMTFYRKRYPIYFNYSIEAFLLERTLSFCYLDVLFSTSLTFLNHIE